MKAIKYETAVRPGGKVEVIVLVRDDPSDSTHGLQLASESSMGFWNNPADDEIWNSANLVG
jgi:hypothetical protein